MTVVTLSGLGCRAIGAASPVPGPELYRDCVTCHGPSGAGNAAIGVPRIAGMPQWYIASQLQRFQDGLRGKHPDDYAGLRMRAMSQQLMSADEIARVATYVSELPPVVNPATLTDGKPAAGQPMFVVCMACHGPRGAGNELVHAPAIAGLDDWYIARQLRKFRAGVRGKAEGDTVGPIMQAIASTLSPASIDDVAAYVHSLPPPKSEGTGDGAR